MADLGDKPSGPAQPRGPFPFTKFGAQQRAFQSAWYQKYPWLEYSRIKDRGFCFPCRIFQPSSSSFVSTGFANWKKPELLREHDTSKVHLKAMGSWNDFKTTGQLRPIDQEVVTIPDTHIDQNRLFLDVVVGSVLFCAKQELALR